MVNETTNEIISEPINEVEYVPIRNEYPRSLGEFIGNTYGKKQLSILVNNFFKFNRPVPNILFYGGPGLGKTTLAQICANELKFSNFVYFIGSQLTQELLNNILIKLTPNNIIFIDEIHALDKKLFEVLYPIVQDKKYKTDIILKNKKGQVIYKALIDSTLPTNTVIIGATTDLSIVPKPLIDRFNYRINLVPYTAKEIFKIIKNFNLEYGIKDGIEVDDLAIHLLTDISQGVPRIAKNYYMQSLDLVISEETHFILYETIKKIMKLNRVNHIGLDAIQQQYLKYLKTKTTPVGIAGISAAIGYPQKDIEILVEPYLLQKEIVLRTPRGRIISDVGRQIRLTI